MAICQNKIYIKISESMISYKEFCKIDFLYENLSDIFYFFKKNFKFQFDNFDEFDINKNIISPRVITEIIIFIVLFTTTLIKKILFTLISHLIIF